ncbi:MAG: hypothetical protein JWN14_1656 [Chthonomonadales bacterium]|nr:hypothetical protein [Chthonomonadales bacterium]
MQVFSRKVLSCLRGLLRTSALVSVGAGAFSGQASRGQAPMPPSVPAQEAQAPKVDPFFTALESLSKRYNIAFVAEGTPFPPSVKNGTVPSATPDVVPQEEAQDPSGQKELSQEEVVQKIAERFDYTAVRKGDVYLLTKRYTNPDDLPEVTPEECRRIWLGVDAVASRISTVNGAPVMNHTEKEIAVKVNGNLLQLSKSRHRFTLEEFIDQILYGYHGSGILTVDQPGNRFIPDLNGKVMSLMSNFVLEAYSDRIQATRSLLANSRPLDPVFHWQTLGQSPVFGYDTQFHPQADLLFIPAGDCDRINVAPYGTPMPRANFWMRTETQLPDPDPTDPKTLPAETKRFLDDNGRSSRAITLAEAIAPINKRVPKTPGYKIYQVDPTYAGKRVTLVGTDKLSPETLMQSLAAVYGLGVEHRRDDHVVLNWVEDRSLKQYMYRDYGKPVRAEIPAPIYRVIHARFLAGRTKTKNQEGPRLLDYEAQYEFQRIAASFRNTAMRMFRYLAEPKVKEQPKERLALSQLGDRERMLFMFAQTVSVYAAACEVADIPLPPYLLDRRIFDRFDEGGALKFTGGVYRKGTSPQGPYIYDPIYFSRITNSSCPDNTARLALFVTYVDPKSGVTYGPVQFLDLSLYLPDLQ